MDGNFKMAPPGFKQLYVIHASMGESSVPVIFGFLERKNQAVYEELFEAINHQLEDMNLTLDPDKIVCDFESGVIQAINSTYGNVEIQGCFYHLCQSTWRKIQDLELVNRYKEDGEFKLFVGQLDALAFLPLEDVVQGFRYLEGIAPDNSEGLVDYFGVNYAVGTVRHRDMENGNFGINFRRIPPKFPPPLWNVRDATVNNDPRTNNICESWNYRFSSLVGQKHPPIWRAIKFLKREEACASAKIQQYFVGVLPQKRTKQVYVNQQQRLRNLCIEYERTNINMQEFLRGVGHTIHLGDD